MTTSGLCFAVGVLIGLILMGSAMHYGLVSCGTV